MTVSVVQTLNLASYSGSLAANATPGNTLLFLVGGFSITTTATSSAPKYNGAAVTGAAQVWTLQSGTGSNAMYSSMWILPNISGAVKTCAITVAGCSAPSGDGALIVLEVAGLGTTPTTGTAVTSSATSGNASIGPTAALASVPALVVAQGAIFGNWPSAGPTSPWTSVSAVNHHAITSYQIPSSAGSTYTWTETGNGSPFAGGIVEVYPTASPAPSGLLMASIV